MDLARGGELSPPPPLSLRAAELRAMLIDLSRPTPARKGPVERSCSSLSGVQPDDLRRLPMVAVR